MTMNEPPEYLPEEGWHDDYDEKRKNDFRQFAGLWKVIIVCLVLLPLLVLVLICTMSAGVSSPDRRPRDYPLTVTSQVLMFQQTATALDATAQYNRQQAALIVLDNQVVALGLTATALSDQSQGRATQQVALDFQRTQTALSQAETQAALDIATTQNALNPATSTAVPGSHAAIGIDDTFRNGISGGVWQSDAGHWLLTENTLTAAHDGAWLLTQRTDFTNYTLEVFFTPPVNVAGDTVFLLNNRAEATNNLALRLVNDGREFTTIGLYTFAGKRLLDSNGMVSDMAVDVLYAAVDGLPQNGLSLTARIDVRDDQLTVSIAGQTLLEYALSTRPVAGAVGLHVPTGTQIHRIRVMP